jgi:hypothetical protein
MYHPRRLLTTLFFLLLSLCKNSSAENSVKIIPDSTQKKIQIEVARTHSSTYKVQLLDDNKKVIYKGIALIDSIPKMISIDWSFCKPGFYYVVLDNKKEQIKLLFIKKEEN